MCKTKKNMKKIVLMLALFCTSQFVSAQEIGLRLGDLTGSNAAIDAVFALGKFSRFHAYVFFKDRQIKIDALWDLIDKLVNGEALKLYFGIGPSALFSSPEPFIGVRGEISLEYRFKEILIVLGLDHKPTL